MRCHLQQDLEAVLHATVQRSHLENPPAPLEEEASLAVLWTSKSHQLSPTGADAFTSCRCMSCEYIPKVGLDYLAFLFLNLLLQESQLVQLPSSARYQQIARRAWWLVLLRMQHGQARNSSCSGFQMSQVRSMQCRKV